MARIGLVAGEGNLPILFSEMAKQKGDTVIAFCLKGVTDKTLEEHVHKAHWLDWGDMKKAVLLLAVERIKKIVMLGKIKKEIIFKEGDKLDSEARKAIDDSDKKDYSILEKVTNFLSKIGVEVIDSTTYLKEFMPPKGTLTKREPVHGESEDIKYGMEVAKMLSGFDIGQTVVIKDKTIIAVEAAEGTDETIARAGGLVNGGFVAVKVSRPHQDMRFDVPLVGLGTLKTLIRCGGAALALEAGKTILVDKEEVIKLADEKNISIVVV